MKQFNISYAQEQFKPVHAIVETTDGSDCKDIAIIKWNRASEILPLNPNHSFLCVTGPFTIKILSYDHEAKCWNNEYGDFEHETSDVTFWAKMPEIPNLDTKKLS